MFKIIGQRISFHSQNTNMLPRKPKINFLSEDYHSDVIIAFNSISRYLDDILNIDRNFFDSMVNRIYSSC